MAWYGWLIGCCLFLATAVVSAAAPQTPAEAQQQIEQIQAQMRQLNQWLNDVKSEKSAVEQQLEQQEKSIQQLQKEIELLEQTLEKGRDQLGQLQRQQKSLQQDIASQYNQIAAQLRAVYRSGNQENLKLLLNGSADTQTMRLMYYNRYFSNARQSLINGFLVEINDLHLVEKSIRALRAQQERDLQRLESQQSTLSNQQTQRQALLVRIQHDLRQGGQQARQLQENEQQLATLLKRLEEALADINLQDLDADFAGLKGKLVRPLPRLDLMPSSGQINLGGVGLSANLGTVVKAIYHGRVVFAEWLRGFGFLIILDHGDGYMSLYGYNQSLLKEVGEWVNANDAIATVGSSGGRTEPGLFFAIRHNGVPVAPLDWIRSG